MDKLLFFFNKFIMNKIVISFLGIIDLDLEKHFIFQEFFYLMIKNEISEIYYYELIENISYLNEKLEKEEIKNDVINRILSKKQNFNLKKIDIKNFLDLIKKYVENFEELFLVYFFLKNLNFEIKIGLVFGYHYLAYEKNKIHSNFLVKILDKKKILKMNDILRMNRISVNSQKNCLMIYFDKKDIDEFNMIISKEKNFEKIKNYFSNLKLDHFYLKKMKK